ncbi:hydroxysteroid (20-beta) dehydrogenase 2 [Chelmon rostratus]|uniref:hydroxysteroid (20-beta) dehydrogenase 2 n=1 Tax=Chelmon rostratus TaxID=109905 RepID=UPI001BE741B5|nr:hydroxysteroid (20-beta) dehydrogenase 2 [Chelmon rostratus]
MSFTDILAVVGGFIVAFHLLKLAWRCWCGFRQFVLSELWQMNLRSYGKWAVVTGATSGIGKAYANELARRGLDVVLVSRSNDKLQMAAKEIEDQYGRKTRTIQVDFTDGHSIYPVIAKELQGLEIGILVNNVGMTCSDNFAYFLEIPEAEQKITQIINCNMLSVPQMTRLVLPDMVKRGTGLIINISSEVGIHPQPLLSLYSATKIFVTYFSQCLHAEYKSQGIIVQCVAPFLVSTNMTKNMPTNLFVKSAAGFVREALNTVGLSSYTSGCLSHALQDMALTILLPDWLRMSSVLIRKLRHLVIVSKYERGARREKEKHGDKEE